MEIHEKTTVDKGECIPPKKSRKRKRSSLLSKLSTLFIVIALLGGVGLLLYPTVSEKVNDLHMSRAIAGYAKEVENLDETDYEGLFAAARAYNEALLTNPSRFQPLEEESAYYNTLLNPGGSGIMGYVSIPKIEVRLPIYHGTDEAVLQVAIGHIEGSSLPVGGASTHTVISGHRGLPSAKLFTRLDELAEGDTFTLTVLNRELYYQVDQIAVVLPSELENIDIVPGEDYCTLVTCTPYGINSHRMLVRGHRIDALPESDPDNAGSSQAVPEESASATQTAENGHAIPDWMPLAFAAFAVIVIGGALLVPVKKKK